MPKIKMPKLKKSKKSKKHSNDDECGPVYGMCPQTCPQYCPRPCSQYCPHPCSQPRYTPSCFTPQRMPDPCYRPACPMPYPRPQCLPPPPEPRTCFPPMPCPQTCPKPCPLPCPPPCSQSCPPPQPCSQPRPTRCHPPCFQSTLRSSCDHEASVQRIIVERGPAIIQNIIFDKEFCEKYFETYGCYPAIDGLPFQLPTQHVTLGDNCDDDDCSACVNTIPCAPPNRNVCAPPCGRAPCNINPVSYNKYYPSPCPC